jgi:hypothetical protein
MRCGATHCTAPQIHLAPLINNIRPPFKSPTQGFFYFQMHSHQKNHIKNQEYQIKISIKIKNFITEIIF